MRKILSIIALLTMGLVLVACGKTTYTVTFESNGGTEITQAVVEEGKLLDEPTEPDKDGFDFQGWFKEVGLTTEWDFEVDVVTENITLYAKWTTSDQGLVDAAYDWLSLGDLSALTNASPRLILPTTKDGVAISWSIDKMDYIAANGLISQPTFEEGNQTVTLTATLVKGSISRTKTFTATVIALPSVEDTEPLINEDFTSYQAGNILDQTGIWGPVSGKTGSSLFTVVTSLTPAIPGSSYALKIEALTELQIEAPIVHTYDLVVIEVDLMQTTTSGGSAINIQSSSSSPVIGFGLDGASLFWRVDNGSLNKTEININQWYTMRVEIDLANKTLEAFYYEDGQLIAITPGKVNFVGTTALQSIFIRSGSSTTTELRAPAYVTNIIANRIEALARPDEEIKLGAVTDIDATVSIEEGTTFTPDVPKVYNYYGAQELLTAVTDYTLVVTNPVDVNVPGDYTVTYTFTNVHNSADVKIVTQSVNVYSPAEPNEITAATATEVGYLEGLTDVSVTVVQPSGTLYYLLSQNATEDKASIMAGTSVQVASQSIAIDDLVVGENTYIHFFVDLNGDSNIYALALTKEAVTEIATAAEFMAVFSSTATEIIGSYALTADIDLTGQTWADGNTSFKGRLYGNDYVISNLVITKTGTNYGGLFARANGAVIRDIVLDNIQVTAADRAGILVGRVENTATHIENIVIMNSSVNGASSNGVGGVIGLVSKDTELFNVTILDSTVITTGQKNVGGAVGRVDGGTLFAEDIYVRGILVQSTVTGALDMGVGGLVGYIRDSVTSIVTANRVVIVDTEIDSEVGGALFGYIRFAGSATAQNVYVDVDFINANLVATGLVGRVNNETDKISETTIFGSLVGATEHAQAQNLTNVAVPTDLAWWTTNLPVFTTNDLWALDTNNIFALDNYLENSKPMINVTLHYNVLAQVDEVIQIRQDQVFSHDAPSVPGYAFVGWYTDEALTTELPVNQTITAEVTLYGKYEPVPASQVSFVTNVDGLSVPTQDVNYGELATLPVVASQMIEGVMKEVTGWTLNGNPFDFSTPVVASIELVAVWETESYSVTFNGGTPVSVLYGELVSAPTEVPTHYFAEVTFSAWQLSGVDYDFNTPVTSDLALVAAFNTPASISIDNIDEFYYMATVESTYNYVLSTNLDFTGYAWTYVNTAFKGTLDGQGFTVSNISMLGLTGYAGIFPRANGATIRNLVVDSITIQTSARAGVLVGRVENGDTLIENVVVKNSSVEGSDSNGVGGLIGQVSRKTEVYNVAVINTTVSNVDDPNVGGLVGRVDSAPLFADDIFISNVQVITTTTKDSDAGASAFVGYVRDNASSLVSAMRVVVANTTVSANRGGAFIGYNRYPGTSTLADAYFGVTFTNNIASSLIGYDREQVVVLDQSTIFGHFTGAVLDSKTLALTNDAVPTDAAWWTTNINNIAISSLWVVNPDGSVTLALLN